MFNFPAEDIVSQTARMTARAPRQRQAARESVHPGSWLGVLPTRKASKKFVHGSYQSQSLFPELICNPALLPAERYAMHRVRKAPNLMDINRVYAINLEMLLHCHCTCTAAVHATELAAGHVIGRAGFQPLSSAID